MKYTYLLANSQDAFNIYIHGTPCHAKKRVHRTDYLAACTS